MKIAVDVLSIREDGSAGGATGFALELIKGLAVKQDVKVMVLCADWNISLLKRILPANIQFCQVVGQRRIFGIGWLDRIINKFLRAKNQRFILAENGVDLLYCPFSAATYKEKKIPTVSTILDIQHEYYPQFFTPQELEHRRKFYREIVKKVERVTCISDYTKDTFCDKYDFPKDRAETIYIAIQNRFDKEDDAILDKLQIRAKKYIVFPANFWEHKNHKLLLNAFAMYTHERNDMTLVLTGNPLEQASYYEELLKAMKIDSNTVITGYVSNEELYSILKNAKGLIYPSLFEGFGIPVVEAMHLHKLIACSNLTSLPEIGCDAICYFDPKRPEEILRGLYFLSDGEVTTELIEEYDRKLADYEADKMVEAYLKVFQDTIEKKEDIAFVEEVEGFYPDGWCMPEVQISLKDRQGGFVVGRLQLPEFVNRRINVIIDNNGEKREVLVSSGEAVELNEEIKDAHYSLQIQFVKPWCPKDVLGGEDVRLMGLMLDCLSLKQNDGEVLDICNL